MGPFIHNHKLRHMQLARTSLTSLADTHALLPAPILPILRFLTAYFTPGPTGAKG